MHICFVSHEYPILNLHHGGVGTFIRNLSYKLVEQGISVSIVRLTNNKKSEIIDDHGVQVHIVSKFKINKLNFITNAYSVNRCIKKIHKQNPIDFVETTELGLAFLHKINGIKYVIRMNGGHHFFTIAENRKKEWRKVWQEKKSFQKADYILAVSEYVAKVTSEALGLDLKTITIIYNPINTERFYQCDINIVEPFTIFFAGTIVEKKGIRQLVQSLEYLVDDFPQIKLLIAGRDATLPGTNIPYRPILEKEISPKIKNHIEFLGIVPNFEIPKHIEKAHLCCYPSHMEAMPLAWLEVLAMGKIFIGSKTGPGPEAVHHKVTGLLANPHQPKDIADNIRFVFEHYELCVEMGRKAREEVLRKFDVDVLVQDNRNFYQSILSK